MKLLRKTAVILLPVDYSRLVRYQIKLTDFEKRMK